VPGWKNPATAWWQLDRFVDQQGENRRCGNVATTVNNASTRAYGRFRGSAAKTAGRPRRANNGHPDERESEVAIGRLVTLSTRTRNSFPAKTTGRDPETAELFTRG